MAIKILIVAVLSVLITSCSLAGAVRDRLHNYRMVYCSKTSDSISKKVAIMAIKSYLPLYPKNGICLGFNQDNVTFKQEQFVNVFVFPEQQHLDVVIPEKPCK